MKQRIKAFFGRRGALAAVCYLAAAALWLGYGVFAFAGDALARADGRLTETTLTAGEFRLADLEYTGTQTDAETGESAEVLQTTSGDPQMILEDVSGRVVRTVQVWAEYEGTAREMCLYYTNRVGEPYSQDKRVFPSRQADGSYLYTLPRGRIVSLRLDPCSPETGKTVTIHLTQLRLNSAIDTLGYFVPSWYQLFCFVLYPGLAAAAISWALALLRALAARRKKA